MELCLFTIVFVVANRTDNETWFLLSDFSGFVRLMSSSANKFSGSNTQLNYFIVTLPVVVKESTNHREENEHQSTNHGQGYN